MFSRSDRRSLSACVVASHLRGRTGISGKVLLTSGSVLGGVLLAVYGQTDQTGADAYELFTGWAALILGWVTVSGFAALWVAWLFLSNTGAILYWNQVGETTDALRYEWPCLAVASLARLAPGAESVPSRPDAAEEERLDLISFHIAAGIVRRAARTSRYAASLPRGEGHDWTS